MTISEDNTRQKLDEVRAKCAKVLAKYAGIRPPPYVPVEKLIAKLDEQSLLKEYINSGSLPPLGPTEYNRLSKHEYRIYRMTINEAHALVRKALREAKLQRQPCEVCGLYEHGRSGKYGVHAHHDNYLKPLEVRWLCRVHHAREHGLDSFQ